MKTHAPEIAWDRVAVRRHRGGKNQARRVATIGASPRAQRAGVIGDRTRRGRQQGALIVAVLALLLPQVVLAGLDQPVAVIRSPTAGLVAHREYRLEGRVGPESSILLVARFGFKEVVHVGVSYGVQRVFERSDVAVNDHPGFEVRARLVPETRAPAVAVGFDSQGWGAYDEALERYERKSLGFYFVASKNWRLWVGELSLHAGVNYSLEDAGDDDPNVFAAAEWSLARGFALLGDVDAARNDNADDGRFGGGGAYVDAGVRVWLGERASLMLVLSDLTGNFEPAGDFGREMEVSFIGGL